MFETIPKSNLSLLEYFRRMVGDVSMLVEYFNMIPCTDSTDRLVDELARLVAAWETKKSIKYRWDDVVNQSSIEVDNGYVYRLYSCDRHRTCRRWPEPIEDALRGLAKYGKPTPEALPGPSTIVDQEEPLDLSLPKLKSKSGNLIGCFLCGQVCFQCADGPPMRVVLLRDNDCKCINTMMRFQKKEIDECRECFCFLLRYIERHTDHGQFVFDDTFDAADMLAEIEGERQRIASGNVHQVVVDVERNYASSMLTDIEDERERVALANLHQVVVNVERMDIDDAEHRMDVDEIVSIESEKDDKMDVDEAQKAQHDKEVADKYYQNLERKKVIFIDDIRLVK